MHFGTIIAIAPSFRMTWKKIESSSLRRSTPASHGSDAILYTRCQRSGSHTQCKPAAHVFVRFVLAKTWPSRVCAAVVGSFESCVPDAVFGIQYVRAAPAECWATTCECINWFFVFSVSFSDRATHRVKRLLCCRTFINAKRTKRTNKKLPSSFYTFFFSLLFVVVHILRTIALCVGLCCVKCVRINSTKRFTFAFVRLCVGYFPYRVPRFEYTIFSLSFSPTLSPSIPHTLFLSTDGFDDSNNI